MSDKGRKLFGFEPESPLTYDLFRDRVLPEDRARLQSIVERAIQTKSGYEAEYRIQLPDGTLRWISARGQCVFDEKDSPNRLVAISMDVTERKQAEQLFELAAEASPSGIVLADADGRIVLVNTQVEKLFGYRRDELVGRPFEALVPERFAAQDPFHRKQFPAHAETRPMAAGGDFFGLSKEGMSFQSR